MNIKELWTYVINQLSTVELADIIDILLVTFILYSAYKFMRDRRAVKLAVGIIVIALINLLANVFETFKEKYKDEFDFE